MSDDGYDFYTGTTEAERCTNALIERLDAIEAILLAISAKLDHLRSDESPV